MKVINLLFLFISIVTINNQANAALVADYRFNNNLASSVAGSVDLVNLGPISYENATIDGQNDQVIRYQAGTGFRFDTTGLIANDEYTIVVEMALDDTNDFVKLADFQNLTLDVGLYNYNGILLVYNQADGTGAVINNSQFHQVVMTRSATDEVNAYVDGELQLSFIDGVNETQISVDNVIHFLRDDDGTGNLENSDGRVARIMVFDEALTANAVAGLGIRAPVPVPTISQYMLILLALLILLKGLIGLKSNRES